MTCLGNAKERILGCRKIRVRLKGGSRHEAFEVPCDITGTSVFESLQQQRGLKTAAWDA